ncbi:MAG: hypothetical protein JNK25_11945 [Phycisphaerae bacterium]|nr:hypothetical protein [Phycisphaerae bacterium]
MLRLTRDSDFEFDPAHGEGAGPFPFRYEPLSRLIEAKPPIDALPDPEIELAGWVKSERRRLPSRNPILEWLSQRDVPHRDYVRHLARRENELSATQQIVPALRDARARLALGLFIDFSREHGLTPLEMATLLDSPRRIASEAVSYLLAAAATDGSNQAA